MRRAIVAAIVAAGLVVGTGGASLAGERTGNGKETPAGEKARSLCAYSGLEDFEFESPAVPGVTQNWGQIIKIAGPLGGANSVLTPFGEEGCNAHLYPNK
jgi:hypothetical protein